MRHLFGYFSIKKLLFLWYFKKKWLCSIWVILCCFCRVEVSPFCRRTAFFCLEDSVKMSATRESTLGWNDVVGIIWIFQHHLFFAALRRISLSHIRKLECRHWSKNWLSSFFEIQSVRERVSMFTLQSLYPKFAHQSSRLFWMKSLRSSEINCKDSILSVELYCLAECAPPYL